MCEAQGVSKKSPNIKPHCHSVESGRFSNVSITLTEKKSCTTFCKKYQIFEPRGNSWEIRLKFFEFFSHTYIWILHDDQYKMCVTFDDIKKSDGVLWHHRWNFFLQSVFQMGMSPRQLKGSIEYPFMYFQITFFTSIFTFLFQQYDLIPNIEYFCYFQWSFSFLRKKTLMSGAILPFRWHKWWMERKREQERI